MSKVSKAVELAEEALAFEMIELACDEVDSLTRAFDMINDLCKELTQDLGSELLDEEGEELPKKVCFH